MREFTNGPLWVSTGCYSRKDVKQMAVDIWTYRGERLLGVDVTRGVDVTGFSVEAIDGSIGRIDDASYDVGTSEIVVDTGPWIFGRKVVLPAGVVERIDLTEETVYVHRTKDQIKNAPELDLEGPEDAIRDQIGSYYGPGGAGHRDWD
jgi:hypothetical protein